MFELKFPMYSFRSKLIEKQGKVSGKSKLSSDTAVVRLVLRLAFVSVVHLLLFGCRSYNRAVIFRNGVVLKKTQPTLLID